MGVGSGWSPVVPLCQVPVLGCPSPCTLTGKNSFCCGFFPSSAGFSGLLVSSDLKISTVQSLKSSGDILPCSSQPAAPLAGVAPSGSLSYRLVCSVCSVQGSSCRRGRNREDTQLHPPGSKARDGSIPSVACKDELSWKGTIEEPVGSRAPRSRAGLTPVWPTDAGDRPAPPAPVVVR